jgi:hypothetical protein
MNEKYKEYFKILRDFETSKYFYYQQFNKTIIDTICIVFTGNPGNVEQGFIFKTNSSFQQWVD